MPVDEGCLDFASNSTDRSALDDDWSLLRSYWESKLQAMCIAAVVANAFRQISGSPLFVNTHQTMQLMKDAQSGNVFALFTGNLNRLQLGFVEFFFIDRDVDISTDLSLASK